MWKLRLREFKYLPKITELIKKYLNPGLSDYKFHALVPNNPPMSLGKGMSKWHQYSNMKLRARPVIF